MQCLILAGGLGTRMRHLAPDLPKALLDVDGRPFAHHQLTLLAAQGVTRVVYALGHLGAPLREYAGDGGRWGLELRYCDEGERLLGTAGAVRLAVDAGLLDEGFFTLYGDSYPPADYRAVWDASGRGARCVMTVYPNAGRWERCNVRFENGRLLLYQKALPDPATMGMEHVDHGLLVLTRQAIQERVPPGRPADLAEVLHRMSVAAELQGFEVSERFYEVGSEAGLRDFREYVGRRTPRGAV